MRTTVIPAQITTVEDIIVGNLTLKQILILIIPVLAGSVLYILLIPAMEMTLYKAVAVSLLSIFCITLSVRIRQKILLDWVHIISKWYFQPRYFVFDKNDTSLRTIEKPPKEKNKSLPEALRRSFLNRVPLLKNHKQKKTERVPMHQDYINLQNVSIRFTKRKGGVSVAFEHSTK